MTDLRYLPSAPAFSVQHLLEVCEEAGRLALDLRRRGLRVQSKQDGSPVTNADLALSELLESRLLALSPTFPVLCEETLVLPDSDTFWILDPLDGTRELMAGRDAFTINIALIQNGSVVAGLIYHPVTDRAWWGGPHWGAFDRNGALAFGQGTGATVLVSPREPPALLEQWRRQLAATNRVCFERVPGAMKYPLLVSGHAIAHARTAVCSAWDVAAGQALVEGAGGVVTTYEGGALRYHRELGAMTGWQVNGLLAGRRDMVALLQRTDTRELGSR